MGFDGIELTVRREEAGRSTELCLGRVDRKVRRATSRQERLRPGTSARFQITSAACACWQEKDATNGALWWLHSSISATAPEGRTATRLAHLKQTPERTYQFLIRPQPKDETYEIYRERRAAILAAYCQIAKVRRPELLDIIGIATEPVDVEQRSEDLAYLDARIWSQEDEARTRELQTNTGILVSPRETAFHDDEYPAPPAALSAAVGVPKATRGQSQTKACETSGNATGQQEAGTLKRVVNGVFLVKASARSLSQKQASPLGVTAPGVDIGGL